MWHAHTARAAAEDNWKATAEQKLKGNDDFKVGCAAFRASPKARALRASLPQPLTGIREARSASLLNDGTACVGV